MAEHLIGLLLGTEEDWPGAFEQIVSRLPPLSVGGETHTFTEVDEFGGGFVDQLNQLSGNPVPAPECTTEFNPADFVAPGSATEAEDEEPGVHHYQCCIHPWMRVDVIVR